MIKKILEDNLGLIRDKGSSTHEPLVTLSIMEKLKLIKIGIDLEALVTLVCSDECATMVKACKILEEDHGILLHLCFSTPLT